MAHALEPPVIDWDRIRSPDECVPLMTRSIDRDTGQPQAGDVRLMDVDHGEHVRDARGRRFRVMGHGSVQGTVILRDRYRRMFHAVIETIVRPD